MLCPVCRKKIDDNSHFCQYCGEAVEVDNKMAEAVPVNNEAENHTSTSSVEPSQTAHYKSIFLVIGVIALVCFTIFWLFRPISIKAEGKTIPQPCRIERIASNIKSPDTCIALYNIGIKVFSCPSCVSYYALLCNEETKLSQDKCIALLQKAANKNVIHACYTLGIGFPIALSNEEITSSNALWLTKTVELARLNKSDETKIYVVSAAKRLGDYYDNNKRFQEALKYYNIAKEIDGSCSSEVISMQYKIAEKKREDARRAERERIRRLQEMYKPKYTVGDIGLDCQYSCNVNFADDKYGGKMVKMLGCIVHVIRLDNNNLAVQMRREPMYPNVTIIALFDSKYENFLERCGKRVIFSPYPVIFIGRVRKQLDTPQPRRLGLINVVLDDCVIVDFSGKIIPIEKLQLMR